MSAAFRNFILTFVIMLAVFGFLAYKALPDINAVLFPEEESSAEESAVPVSYSGETETSHETSGEEPVSEDNVFSCIIAAKNDAGDICSLLYVNITESTGDYVVCRIPVDMYIKDNNIYRLISAQLGANNEEYMLKKLSPLIGKDVEHYIICDSASYGLFASVAEKAGTPVSVNLPYAVRYLDPNFINIKDPSDEMYITIPAGNVNLSPENASVILNSYRDDDSVANYDFQESTLGLNVFRSIVSISALRTDTDQLSKLYAAVKTDIPLADVLRYSSLLFAFSEYNVNQIVYPSADYINNKVNIKIPNWEKGVNALGDASGK